MNNTEKLNETIHIVYASDNSFAQIMGVSISSLFCNCSDIEDIVVYILESGITEYNRKKIEAIFHQFHRALPHWIRAKNISDELKIDVAMDRGSLSQYARLFVSSILPKELDRVLYLDCDIIVNQSIATLWKLDMQGKIIAALMDAFSKCYRANIGLQPDDIMFNSGVMLIDLKRWKEEKIEEKILRFMMNHKGKVQQGDQGTLNAVLSHEIYCFEPKYNSITIFYDFDYREMMIYRKTQKYYSQKQIMEAIEEPVIIHFTTSFLSRRPWYEGCNHRYVKEWNKYKTLTPWNNDPVWPYVRKKGCLEYFIIILEKISRPLMIRITGILQAYGRPLLYRLLLR